MADYTDPLVRRALGATLSFLEALGGERAIPERPTAGGNGEQHLGCTAKSASPAAPPAEDSADVPRQGGCGAEPSGGSETFAPRAEWKPTGWHYMERGNDVLQSLRRKSIGLARLEGISVRTRVRARHGRAAMTLRHEALKDKAECQRVLEEIHGSPTQSTETVVSTPVGEVFVSIIKDGERAPARLAPAAAPQPPPPSPPPREEQRRRKRRRGH